MVPHPWVSLCIKPVFALANAGLALSWGNAGHPVTAAVFQGLALGKPAGILLFSWLALRTGLAIRAPDLTWRVIAGASFRAGIGFTMALLMASLALHTPLMAGAKIGIFLASLFSAAVSLALLR